MTCIAAPRALSAATKRALRILFIAKHVHWEGGLHPSDGTHATYHREMRSVLEQIGVDLQLADSYEALFGVPDVDFVFPLLNRGGFLNSEMLLPLLCERSGIPYLGASPILRGLSDDKHLSKRVAAARGVATAPWAIFRRGAPIDLSRCPAARKWVVKPNASSASWGISAAYDHADIAASVGRIHQEGHDAIVETFIPGHDIEVCVVTLDGEPYILPIQIVEQHDPQYLRTYLEKRNLVDDQAYAIRPLADDRIRHEAERQSIEMMKEFRPFDYGRFEFRLDHQSGALSFMEVNLNCNLWSKKTIAMAAGQIGWSHAELIETILAESLSRHGLITRTLDRVAA